MPEFREASPPHAFSKALYDLSTECERLAEEAAAILANPIAQATRPAPPEQPDRRNRTAPDRPLLSGRDPVESRASRWVNEIPHRGPPGRSFKRSDPNEEPKGRLE
jgi:hypothetical protein